MRPSELLGIDPEDEVTTWSFDRAVVAFGTALESKLQFIARNSKKQKEAERKVQHELDKWLRSGDAPNGTSRGRYRDPMNLM